MNKSLDDFILACQSLLAIAATAERGGQSLGGANRYAQKFHSQLLPLHTLEVQILATMASAGINAAIVKKATANIETIKSVAKQGRKRLEAMRSLQEILHGPAAAAFSDKEAPPAPTTEAVLPKAVVIPAKKAYLITVVVQANQCYESRCYDACAVMIRKLVEILIIEVYEAHKKEAEIKDKNGDYFLLGPLVDAILKAPHWNLARESKSTLPKAKELGNRSAHNRRYVATVSDVNVVLPGLRVLADDLLHLARLK